MNIDIQNMVKSANIVFITIDSLRYDVANKLFANGATPNFQKYFPEGWTKSHTSGSFTYAAHHAFFAGFLPTPADDPKTPRLFGAQFAGSETINSNTLVFDTPDIVSGFASLGFRTVCIGGVGFFNKQTALGSVLPALFQESYWQQEFGVTDPESTANQFAKAAALLEEKKEQQVFLFINISAVHQPNYFYLHTERQPDTLASHAAALQYVDRQFPLLIEALQQTGRDSFCILCSDHGTAYGEEGYHGHRLAHSSVWDVPMVSFMIPKNTEDNEVV